MKSYNSETKNLGKIVFVFLHILSIAISIQKILFYMNQHLRVIFVNTLIFASTGGDLAYQRASGSGSTSMPKMTRAARPSTTRRCRAWRSVSSTCWLTVRIRTAKTNPDWHPATWQCGRTTMTLHFCLSRRWSLRGRRTSFRQGGVNSKPVLPQKARLFKNEINYFFVYKVV